MWFMAGTRGPKEAQRAVRDLLKMPREEEAVNREWGEARLLWEIRKAMREEMSRPLAASRERYDSASRDWQGWFEKYVDRQVIVQTPGGTVEGRVTEACERYAFIEEAGRVQVLIYYEHLISLQPVAQG